MLRVCVPCAPSLGGAGRRGGGGGSTALRRRGSATTAANRRGAGVADLETLDTVARRHARARAPAAGRRVEGRQ